MSRNLDGKSSQSEILLSPLKDLAEDDLWTLRLRTTTGDDYGFLCSWAYVRGFLNEFEEFEEDQLIYIQGRCVSADRDPSVAILKRSDIAGVFAYSV